MNSIFNQAQRRGTVRYGLVSIMNCLLALVIGSIATVPGICQDLSSTDHKADENLKRYGDLRRDLKAFMKNSKRDSEPEVKRAAIINLCQLHEFVVADPRFETHESWQGLRIVAANRLKEMAKEIENQRSRQNRMSKSESGNDSIGDKPVDPAQLDNSNNQENLASLGLDSSAEAYRMASQTYNSMGSFSGGPAMIFNYVGGNFGPDHGLELVALIENTIDPTFWRRNGGPGAIEYFEPLRVLVITASTEVQEKTEDLLRKFRFASQ